MNAIQRITLSFELSKIAQMFKEHIFPDTNQIEQKTRAEEIYQLLGGTLQSTAKTNSGVLKGRVNNVKTAKNTKVSTVFALMEISEVITSHSATGVENPLYPQELQPRDRSRDSSQAWVQKTSSTLDPESLGRSGRADTGAPIIGDDNVVESGNGRTMAIQLAYERGQAEEYKEWLIEEADYFGFTPEQVENYKQPILVRIRTSEIDRVQFTVEANQDDKLSFSATERAKTDAKRIDENLLSLFTPGSDGDLLTTSNQKFIHGFLKSLGETEAAQYITTDGKPTQALVTRIKAALFSKAYNDDRLLEMMADQTKPELQNMLNALGAAAPNFIEAQAVNRGNVQDISDSIVDGIEQTLDKRVANAIIDAANTILTAKQNNQDITEYVKQQGLFGDLAEGVPELAIFLSINGRSAKKMAMLFKAMAEYTERLAIDSQNFGLFGEPEPVTIGDALNYAVGVVTEHYESKQSDMFDSFDSNNSKIKDPLTKIQLSKELIQKNEQLKTINPSDPKIVIVKKRVEDIVKLLGGLNEQNHSPFQKAIDDVVAGKSDRGFVTMGTTPQALKIVGIPDTKISINKKVIEKVLSQNLGIPKGENTNIHNITPETLRQLPQQINNPIAIFKSNSSATHEGFVVLTELNEQDFDTGKDKKIIAALHVKRNSMKGVDILNIASVYGRSNNQLAKAFQEDLLYFNKEKGQQFLNTVRLQLPRDVTSDANLFKSNIKTNEDLKASDEAKNKQNINKESDEQGTDLNINDQHKGNNILDSLTNLNHIDEQAHNAATSTLNNDPEPTDKQKFENNYKTGDFKLLGLNICIENPEGSLRAGIDENGESWSNIMTAHYGYIDNTKGIDGDEIDCFVKPGIDNTFNGNIYIIDQVNDDNDLDEHKIIIGAKDRAEAKNIYLAHYAKDWKGLGRIRAVSLEDFKEMLKSNLIEEIAA